MKDLLRWLSHLLRLAVLMPMLALALAATLFVAWPPAADVLRSWESTPVEVNLTENVSLNELSIRSYVYDADRRIIDVFSYVENRGLVDLDDISEQVRHAVIAIEDENFYLHTGIDLSAVFRAGLENVGAGGITQGGSTITQQLIKNLVVGNKVEAERKLQEMAMAKRLEREMGKDEILHLYLNTVYFGQGAYGVQAAAEVYWGLDAADLGWGEAALLAALISNPSGYDPIYNPLGALRQRRIVLNRLAVLGYITQEQADLFHLQPLPTEIDEIELPPRSYFVEEVKQQLLDDPRYLGGSPEDRFNLVFNGGLSIHTTFDPVAQQQAEAAVAATLVEYNEGEHGGVEATMALVALEPDTGAVRAVVGGPGFAQDEEEFNLATQGTRQPGSAFKTFVMMTLFEQGYQPSDRISGRGPCQIPNPGGVPDPYVANNFASSPGQVDTITDQIRVSSNCAFLRLGRAAGIGPVIDTASKMGITTELEPVASLPLGSEEVHPIDMASAYGVMATGGFRYEPYFIERIVDRQGNVLYQHELSGQRVVSPRSACWATDVLENNVINGTGRRAQLPAQTAAGKTGTTEESADAWFVGFTPHLATAVWLGNPNERIPMRRVTGSSYPAMAWGRFMTSYHEGRAVVDFPNCPGEPRLSDLIELEDVFTVGVPCATPLAPEDPEVIVPVIVPVDTDDDGTHDTCVDLLITVGVEPCGFSEFAVEGGEPIPLYCGTPSSIEVECPDGQFPFDADDDGIVDTCVGSVAGSESPAEPGAPAEPGSSPDVEDAAEPSIEP
ncbi:transglycosylase domain-containing protein [Candidatus Poriferisocius sp.]|uniref:transglycosylase domain-containing protein n=1 Tax=Candidatus Poriferisocius sp. TaxID=3101276 RepID=UPI003B026E75